MALISTFARPIDFRTNACCSGVSGWVGSYLGCFLADALAALKAMSSKAVGTFRKFMLTPVLVHMFRGQVSERRGAWSAQDAGASQVLQWPACAYLVQIWAAPAFLLAYL